MTERRKVPVAYVTKWATTRGILVVRGAETYETYLTKKDPGVHLFVGAKQWTEDKDEAETRYRAALKKAHVSAVKKAASLKGRMSTAPVYEDES